MPNVLQKWIYNLSVAAPLLMILAIVWFIEKDDFIVPVICLCVAVLLIILMVKSFEYGKRNIPQIAIHVTSIAPHDLSLISCIISYLLPLLSIALDGNTLLLSGIYFLVFLIVICMNTAIPNIILLLLGYHFYTISEQNGVSGYVLISKRKIRNPKEIRYVYRVFEFLLVDAEGM